MNSIIGRELELEQMFLTLKAERSILLEGPVGTGKTALALAVAESVNKQVIRIDGDQRYSEQKLVGNWDPTLVIQKGYTAESFQPGPLTLAMQTGSILFINELNRMPESVQNILLPALDEKKIQLPQIGQIIAKQGFLVIATQNPRDFVATSSISEALLDRFEWLYIDFPSREDEKKILKQSLSSTITLDSIPEPIINIVLDTVRLTRSHPLIKRGASLRAGIAWVSLYMQLDPHQRTEASLWKIAPVCLSNRIEIQASAFPGISYPKQMKLIIEQLQEEVKKKT